MTNKNWRIFLSYRGESYGKDFCDKLHKFLVNEPFSEELYGKVYFSPETAGAGDNFKRDIPAIMKTVKYFVMPLTKGYFDDFWDQDHCCPYERSITYKEINAAIENNCIFICVKFNDFKMDEYLLRKLFNDNADLITTAVKIDYIDGEEEKLFRKIADCMVKEHFKIEGAANLISNCVPNIFLTSKKETEDSELFPFYQKIYDVKKITFLNYASSSFITGVDIASIYNENDTLKRWFISKLSNGEIEADIILTNPHCPAARDAALYKMYPIGLNMEKDKIILHNMNKLFNFITNNPKAKLNVYTTNIALPYGIMMTEHRNKANNHMKIDLYSAVTDDDRRRPSFYLLQSNSSTYAMYSFFEGNLRRIMNNYSTRYNGIADISWLSKNKKPIIHRGVINPDCLPHTQKGFEECIKARCPIEVDLIELSDGSIVVGREDQNIAQYGCEKGLSEIRLSDLRRINKKAGYNKILTLEELLNLVCGRVPLLIEIKINDVTLTDDNKKYIKKAIEILHKYSQKCSTYFNMTYNSESQGFAIHSSNPYVLKYIKKIDCMIPCGIILAGSSEKNCELEKSIINLNNRGKHIDIFNPDFISADINYLKNGVAKRRCDELNIPILVWTIKNDDDQCEAEGYNCDNIIIEGAESFNIK